MIHRRGAINMFFGPTSESLFKPDRLLDEVFSYVVPTIAPGGDHKYHIRSVIQSSGES